MERTVSQGQSWSKDERGGGTSRKASPGQRCRKAFKEAVSEGGLDFQGYCRLAAQAMLQLAIEEEAAEFIGRTAYERLGGKRTTYRNGYKRRRVLTAEGAIRLAIPQTRNGTKRFKTVVLKPFQRRSEILDALIPQLFVKGLSVRDVSDAFGEVLQEEGLSPATASRVAQSIREDFEAWRSRSLSLYDVLYFFVDGMYLKLHPDQPEKQPILIAYAILWSGRKVLLHVGLGDHESYEACLGFLRDMAERGLSAPLMYCSDDCPGLRKALKAMWPRSLPQKCQAHKLRNILSKLPRGVQAEFAKRIHAVFRARDYEEGLAKGRELIERYRRRFPNAMECLAKSLEECLTCLKLPHAHRIRVRTTNSLERLIEEGRRRTKVIGPMAGETAGLSLIHAVLVDASKRWHGIEVSSYILEKLEDLRATIAPLADSA
jgi:transposase-like protein